MENRRIALIFLGIILNVAGAGLNAALSLPLFLDSIGTIMAAAALGPWLGAFTGFATMLIIGVLVNPVALPFGLVNAMIGVITGLIARRHGFSTLRPLLSTALLLSLLSPILGTVMAVYLFGGITGGRLDTLTALIAGTGKSIFSSAFLVRLPATVVDKFSSVFLVYLMFRRMPPALSGHAVRPASSSTGRPNESP